MWLPEQDLHGDNTLWQAHVDEGIAPGPTSR